MIGPNRARCFSILLAGALLPLFVAGCAAKSNPEWATRPYPKKLHTTLTEDMQVFRQGTDIEIVNTTPRSYSNFDLWINQRYVKHVDSLSAGQTISLSLWDFHDEFGDQFGAGGFFRAYKATPVSLVEIEPGPDQNMTGLITIRREPVKLPATPGAGS